MFNYGWAVLKACRPLFFSLGLDGTFIVIIVIIIIILEGHARKSMAFVYGKGIGIGIFFFCCRRYGRDEVVLGVRC
jgi:hypothetical protein